MPPFFEVLFDPNIVYLALVLGFILLFFAIVVPGTGLIEVFTLFTLIFAGVGVFVLSEQINLLALSILVLGVLPFLLALRKTGRIVYLALSLVALTLGSAYLFENDPWWLPRLNLPMVILVSLLNVSFLWVVVRKSLEASLLKPAQDLSRLLGSTGEAETEVYEEGTVRVASELWSARSNTSIPAGQAVRVVGREGFTLIVEAIPDSAEASSSRDAAAI